VDVVTHMREARRFDNHQPETMLDALTHGLMAEVGEVLGCIAESDFGVNLLHELGDAKWNLIRIADEIGYDPYDFLRYGWGPQPGDMVTVCSLASYAGKVAGVMEKWHRIPRPPWELRDELARHIHGAWQALANLGEMYGYSPARVSQANIDKLTRRYAERELPVKEAT
jgi:hypothetical protein